MNIVTLLGRPGNDLLSRVLRRSTIGSGAFHGRVRNGIGCSHPDIITRSAKERDILFVRADTLTREPAAAHVKGAAPPSKGWDTENWSSIFALGHTFKWCHTRSDLSHFLAKGKQIDRWPCAASAQS
jgi:hypothetical protein